MLPSVLEVMLLAVDSGKSQRGQRWLNVGRFLVQNHSAPSICQKGRESVAAGARALLSYTDVYISALNNYSSPSLFSVLHLEPALCVHVCTCTSFTFCVKMWVCSRAKIVMCAPFNCSGLPRIMGNAKYSGAGECTCNYNMSLQVLAHERLSWNV